jgi:Highly conserved protein containing a thioredoxin domain
MTLSDIPDLKSPGAFSPANMPNLNFDHISNLTDDTGIIQHALFTLPNRKEGYCIDDNARALLLMVWAGKDKKNTTAHRLLPVYLSFIHYMQTGNGFFRNFMRYDKAVTEKRGSEDSFGRTIIALGYLLNEGSSTLLVKTAVEIFVKAYPHIRRLQSLRGMANAIIGLCQFIKYNYPDDLKVELVVELANRMTDQYKQNRKPGWLWFEPVLTYDNAMLPLALLNAYEITQDEKYVSIAIESMQFLESKVCYGGMVRPVGNNGWCSCDGANARFDQQGIDIMAMILYYKQAFRLTRDREYFDKMYLSYQWFTGLNDAGQTLYDHATGGCADGLHQEGINSNEGAESTLAYWISHIVVSSTFEE